MLLAVCLETSISENSAQGLWFLCFDNHFWKYFLKLIHIYLWQLGLKCMIPLYACMDEVLIGMYNIYIC